MVAGENMAFKAKNMSFLSEGNMTFGSNRGSTQMVLQSNLIGTNKLIQAPELHGNLPGAEPGGGAANSQGAVTGTVIKPKERKEEKIIPTDRGATDNQQDFSEVEEKVITGQDDSDEAE
jgi:hypothetical protein